jgi:hypothetical protein
MAKVRVNWRAPVLTGFKTNDVLLSSLFNARFLRVRKVWEDQIRISLVMSVLLSVA